MFNQYPYINLNDLNLDYILKAIKDMRYEVTNFVSINAIKYADPIQWNITSQYEKNTIVIDPQTGTAYISVAPVPAGVALTRPEYWTVVFDLGSFVTRAAQNFTNNWESETTLTATFPTAAGEWLVWGDTLYVANTNITAGDSYVIGGNIRHITVEEVKNTITQLIADNYNAIIAMIGDLNDLTTTAKNNIVAAINELVSGLSDITQAVGDLDDLTTTDKSSAVGAINELDGEIGNLDSEIGNLANLTTTNKTKIVSAINEVNGNVGDLNVLTTTNKNDAVDAINEVNGNVGDLNQLKTTNKSSAVQAVNEINDMLFDSKLVCIGDSWLYNGEGWSTHLQTVLGASERHVYQADGAGFARTGYTTFHQLLENAIADLTASQRSNITHVVIGGGINDQWDTESDLYDAANLLFADTKAAFPRANVYYFANQGNGPLSADYYSRIVNLWNRASDHGVITLEHPTFCMMGAGTYYMNADHVHPTVYGHYLVATTLYENMKGCYLDYIGSMAGVSSGTYYTTRITRHDNIINCHIKFTPTSAGQITDDMTVGYAPVGYPASDKTVGYAPIYNNTGTKVGDIIVKTNAVKVWGLSNVAVTCYADFTLDLVGICD